MKSTIEFLNRAIELHNGNASEVARKVGAKGTGTVGNWKARGRVSPYYAVKLAELIGEDPKEAAAIAGAEAEADEEKRNWMLQKLGGVAASVTMASVILFLTAAPEPAWAKASSGPILQEYKLCRYWVDCLDRRLRLLAGLVPLP